MRRRQVGTAGLTLGISITTSTYINHNAIAQWQTKIEGPDVTLDNVTDSMDGS